MSDSGSVHIDLPPTPEPDAPPVVVTEHTAPEAESEVLKLAREVGEANARLAAAETERDELRRRVESVENDAADAVAAALGAHEHVEQVADHVDTLAALPVPEVTLGAPDLGGALDVPPIADAPAIDAEPEESEEPQLEHWFWRKRR